jgi:Flp pilus assembly protein TadB
MGTEGTEPSEPALNLPPLPAELSTREEELRRMVDAGAATPEELRALAARLEEQRTLEHSAWRREVRPALMEAKKRRFTLGDLRSRGDDSRHGMAMAIAVCFAVLVLLFVASATSFLVLLLPVLGVLVYAYLQGREEQTAAASPPPGADAADDPD